MRDHEEADSAVSPTQLEERHLRLEQEFTPCSTRVAVFTALPPTTRLESTTMTTDGPMFVGTLTSFSRRGWIGLSGKLGSAHKQLLR